MPYDDSQPRDKYGKWTSGGSSGGGLPPSAYAAGMAKAPSAAKREYAPDFGYGPAGNVAIMRNMTRAKLRVKAADAEYDKLSRSSPPSLIKKVHQEMKDARKDLYESELMSSYRKGGKFAGLVR